MRVCSRRKLLRCIPSILSAHIISVREACKSQAVRHRGRARNDGGAPFSRRPTHPGERCCGARRDVRSDSDSPCPPAGSALRRLVEQQIDGAEFGLLDLLDQLLESIGQRSNCSPRGPAHSGCPRPTAPIRNTCREPSGRGPGTLGRDKGGEVLAAILAVTPGLRFHVPSQGSPGAEQQTIPPSGGSGGFTRIELQLTQ